MKKQIYAAVSLFFFSWSPCRAEEPQSCSNAYNLTAKAYRNAAKWISLAGVTSPVTGPLLMGLGPVYFAGKELKDLGIVISGTKEEGDSRKKALGRALTKDPSRIIGSFGAGFLSTAAGMPLSAIATPIVLSKARSHKHFANALLELHSLVGTEITQETKLPRNLRAFYHYVNAENMHTTIPGLYQGDMEKAVFVETLNHLANNHALCPEGAVYHKKEIRTILKGFAYNSEYKIPKSLYEKSDWYQSPLRLYVRHYDNFKSKSKNSRMAVADADPAVRALYEGLAGESATQENQEQQKQEL